MFKLRVALGLLVGVISLVFIGQMIVSLCIGLGAFVAGSIGSKNESSARF